MCAEREARNPPSTAHDIFISYAGTDLVIANELFGKLEQRGLRCFMADWTVAAGSYWDEEICKAIRGCGCFLLVVTQSVIGATPSLVASHHWVVLEIGAAWALGKTIVSAIRDSHIRERDLPSLLRRYQVRRIVGTNQVDELVEELARDSREARALRALAERVASDLGAQQQTLAGRPPEEHVWFVPEISRCNLGNRYTHRTVTIKGKPVPLAPLIEQWRCGSGEPPFLFLIGESGIGKTNFLIAEVMGAPTLDHSRTAAPSPSPSPVAVFLPLRSYDPNRRFWDAAQFLINRPPQSPEVICDPIDEELFLKLLDTGKITLILDGLDELIRMRGEHCYTALMTFLLENTSRETSRIIISCRDHAYKRITSQKGIAKAQVKKIDFEELTDDQVRMALKRRLPESTPAYALIEQTGFHRFARKPLLLDLICQLPREAWEGPLPDPCKAANIYDLWFNWIISKEAPGASLKRIRGSIEQIGIHMLEARSDLVDQLTLQRYDLLPKKSLAQQKCLEIFLKQTQEYWSFVHDSFREFSLARKLVDEWESGEYEFLGRTPSFDYIGAETYEFVVQLFSDGFVGPIQRGLEAAQTANRLSVLQRNNIVRNSFEAAGMIADGREEAQPFIDHALTFLAAGFDAIPLSLLTQYNIVRCLERLHCSAPSSYVKHVLGLETRKRLSRLRVGSLAVRGFHLKEPALRWVPRMAFSSRWNRMEDPNQEKVSQLLVSLLRTPYRDASDPREFRDGHFLVVNAAFALIRWLHETHLRELRDILESISLDAGTRGNLFLALYRLNDPQAFNGFSKSFDGMNLRWVPKSVKDAVRDLGYQSVTF